MFLTEDFFNKQFDFNYQYTFYQKLDTEVCGLFQSASKQCLGTVYADRRDTV